ncbi:MAG: GNAT family N-acetyltransferase [Bacteroidota bacterium]
MSFSIRKATPEDVPGIFSLVQELAEFEQAADQVETSVKQYLKDGFGERPYFECLVAEWEGAGIVGISLYYYAYSTWKGKMLYLDDLVIREAYRRRGIGRALVDQLVKIGLEENARMMKWQVLDWNEPAIKMYESLGSTFDGEWIDVKIYREQMESWEF